MEAIQKSIEALSHHFNNQMEDFQRSLQGAIPATSPTSNIAGQFNSFRNFVLTALAGLQQQVDLLARQTDQLEMRSRAKILLVHGIPEGSGDNLAATVSASLSNHLKLPNLQLDSLSGCHRLGQPKKDKPRAILIRFHDLILRNQVWYAKSALKNSGVTLSEFLTKHRHEVFLKARHKFGVSRCYTKEGVITVIGHDGTRHRVTSAAEVDSIKVHSVNQGSGSTATASSASTASKASKVVQPPNVTERSKRNAKK